VNAALLALEILAVSDDDLAEKLIVKRKNDTAVVLEKNKAIEEKFNY
jgi:5-(carboxyamino)imidazole ribonucleotide mutase